MTWSDPDAYDRAANRLAAMFVENFKKFEKNSPAYIAAAGPVVLQDQNTKVSETVQTDYPSSKNLPGQNTLSTIQADFDPP